MRLLYLITLSLFTYFPCSQEAIGFDDLSIYSSSHPVYTSPPADSNAATVANFQPMVTMEDYIEACGDYQKINQNITRQRLSKLWQRCYAYTAGTLATLYDLERTAPITQFCVPANISPEYTMDQAIKYAKKRPDTLDENPARIILEALAVRYPCEALRPYDDY